MEAGVHFVFELLKIAILSTIYSTVIFLAITALKPKIIKNSKRFWRKCLFTIYGSLFVFMFTYWGDHGLGDSYYIPIPHYKTVNQGDETAYIENSKANQLEIKRFSYDNKYLYAEIADKNQINDDYIVWNLQTDEWKTYSTNSFLILSKTSKTASPKYFKDFDTHYDNYWSGWRFWLLP